jgi:3-oxoacyl-[acyl-carrier-protein] synthase II
VCRPFDKGRDGMVLGEGAGLLVMETEEHAARRGVKPIAEVAGYGDSCDSFHLTRPDPSGEQAGRALSMAMRDAGVAPDEIGYVNAHGTATPPNDSCETAAMRRAFGSAFSKPLVSSTKPMHGHVLGGAGGVEGVIALLSLLHGVIPPNLNVRELDPACEGLNLVLEKPVRRDVGVVMSNNFGFGGLNASVIFRKIR